MRIFFVILNARHSGTPPQTASPINAISDFISANYITRLVSPPSDASIPSGATMIDTARKLPSFLSLFFSSRHANPEKA